MKRVFMFLSLFSFFFTSAQSAQSVKAEKKDFCKEVNVFIGTGGHGHTYPGVCLPFGMVQVSPDTRLEGWDACAGYHYSDSIIYGFSHTHLSGVGVPDYGDILFMPATGKVLLQQGSAETPGYRSKFSHKNEKAEPGYYSVFLDDYKVKAELTATERGAVHKYTYPKTKAAHVIIDLKHRDTVLNASIKQVNKYEVEGAKHSTNWALDKRFFFVARFSKPIKKFTIAVDDILKEGMKSAEGKNIKAVIDFATEENEAVIVKVAISSVSVEGARRNLEKELAGISFEKTRTEAHNKWNSVLSKIDVEGGTKEQREIFYTSLYHCYMTPNLFMDVDGNYRGMDMKIHNAKGFMNFTVFSLWDTYRALHPLFTIIEQENTRNFVNTLIQKYNQYGALPMWELAANDTRCMIGYHAVSLIADAWIKGIGGFDKKAAYTAMKNTANLDKRGLLYYKEFGFVPSNKNSQSVSKTLEYAYDDWCIAQAAKSLNKKHDFENFIRRSQFYHNVFDETTGFMRGRNTNRQWRTPFDPGEPNYDFTEGNSYQYLYVPHDVDGLIKLMGGNEKFTNWLDKLFTTNFKNGEVEGSDISGLIGQYAHGNEPSHHFAYLYNYSGAPWKTQETVRNVLSTMYKAAPDGLCGNEDCGQMSAWYVLSAIGLYQVCPGQDKYDIGSPVFNRITINLENGKKFVIKADNCSPKNKYINSAKLNGFEHNTPFISHFEIMKGGELDLNMSSSPNKLWGSVARNAASTGVDGLYTAVPYMKTEQRNFIDTMHVELACYTEGAKIYYTTDGSEPDQKSNIYTVPLVINKTVKVKFRAYKEGLEPSYCVSADFVKIEAGNDESSSGLRKGLKYFYYSGVYRSIWDFEKETPASSGVVNEINIDKRLRDNWFAMHFTGYIKAPADGEYTFYLNADDGGQLCINGKELFESDGRKEFAFEQHASIILKKGVHKIDIKYFQCTDGKTLEAGWEGPGFKRELIPAYVLYH